MINGLLKRLNAFEFFTGRDGWGGDTMSPYQTDILKAFAQMNPNDGVIVKGEFATFLSKYNELTVPEQLELKRWATIEFVDATWRHGKSFPRPEWAHAHFFPNAPKTGKLLDIAPAHGCHGALLYRDHYKYKLDLHTCDFSPCYNKLLTMLGVKVKHVDLRFDDIGKEYDETFDVIALTEVLEHVDQAAEDRVCAGLHNITHPGTKLLITFPVKAMPHGGVPQPNDWLGHIRQPKVDEVIAKLHGFNSLESGKFSGGRYDQRFIILERK